MGVTGATVTICVVQQCLAAVSSGVAATAITPMKWRLTILTSSAALAAFALFGSPGGVRVVGFSYAVAVDNLATDFPSRIIAVDGRRAKLDDGRVLVVRTDEADRFAALRDAKSPVRFDPTSGVLYSAERIRFCSFDDPRRCQVFTIPLKRKDLRKYASRQVAGARRAPPSSG